MRVFDRATVRRGADIPRVPASGSDTEIRPARRRPVAHRVSGRLAWVLHHAAWRLRLLEYAWPMFDKEIASTVQVPWPTRARMWRRGFLGESSVLYDFEHNDWRDYLSDRARFVQTRVINGAAAVLLDDKSVFQRFVGGETDRLPPVLGYIHNGGIEVPGDTVPLCRIGGWLAAQAVRDGGVVIKPCTGGGGTGVMVVRASGAELTLNGKPTDEEGLREAAASADGCMVSAYVEQHPDIARLYPQTTNTLRILAMQDDKTAPFIAAAALRLGSRASTPTDNWTRGGLSATVNAETGQVGEAAGYPAGRAALDWHRVHPESGVRIAGLVVPNWPAIVGELLSLMRRLPMLRYVGWDVVATEDGFRILEGNNFSDVNLLQIHGPLLSDARVAEFFQRHGVAPGRAAASKA